MYRGSLLIERWSPAEINRWGHAFWKNDTGEYHRGGDQPAIVFYNGDSRWYKNGLYHRDGDRPAHIRANGHMEWYKNGKLHRDEDKPAVVYEDAKMYWYKNEKQYYPFSFNEVRDYWFEYYGEHFLKKNL